MNDEFYIGWEDKAPPEVGSRVHRAVVLLLGLAVALGAGLSLAQRTIGVSVFEWGKVKEFTGVLRSQPYPHLLVLRPGAVAGQPTFSSYYLVKPFKFGLDSETANRLDGKSVSLKGTLIYRGNQTMIEVVTGSIQPLDTSENQLGSAGAPPLERGRADLPVGPDAPQRVPTAVEAFNARRLAWENSHPESLGQQTLVGEIVDSKCYLGVMNPGALTPHRACAIRCISGGIPPVLLVRQANGPALYFLLVSRDGEPVNKQVLNLVAEPVEITGEVERQGELLILRADPATYRRVTK